MEWISDCVATFQGMKKYLSKLLMLAKPKGREILFVYLSAIDIMALI